MGFCKDCIHYGLVDDYWRLGRWTNGCTLTWELKGNHDTCEKITTLYSFYSFLIIDHFY